MKNMMRVEPNRHIPAHCRVNMLETESVCVCV